MPALEVIMVRSFLTFVALAAMLTVTHTPQAARAAVFVVDEGSGLLADAILDGIPFGPPNDGTPDAGGNALAVALKTGVTEQRVVLEIPLAAFTGLTSADIDSATLTFNIDDVIGTFGPGFNFDGTAAQAIFVWAWEGDGSVELSDYTNVAGAPSATVVTGPDGSITDATLAVSGPLSFTVDLTAALQGLLDGAAAHMGITLAVNDDQTATSLDNLGFGGAGPAGVNGSKLPFLTVVTVEAAPPTLTRDELKCQAKLGAGAAKYAASVQKSLHKCIGSILKDAGAAKDTARSAAKCNTTLDPAPLSNSTVAKARARAASTILKACTGLVPDALGSPCDDAATTFGATTECVLDAANDAAQRSVRSTYASACAVLASVGLDASYVTACTQP